MPARPPPPREVVIAEYRISGHVTGGEKPFSLSYIAVIRVRDGLIVSSRDYGDPLEASALLQRASRSDSGANIGEL